jgi:hypothetical protein
MIPVFQQHIHQGEGDCIAACVASLFEIPLSDVPNFLKEAKAKHSWGLYLLKKWLNDKGYGLIHLTLRDEYSIHEINWILAPGIFAIASVSSQQFEGGTHAVVVEFKGADNLYELEIVHDPNPNNGKYIDPKFLALYFIIPFKYGK